MMIFTSFKAVLRPRPHIDEEVVFKVSVISSELV